MLRPDSRGRRGGRNAAPAGQQEGVKLGRLAGLYLGAFLSTFAFNAATVALPLIGRELHADAGQQNLVVAGYGAAFAALLVIGGRVGDLSVLCAGQGVRTQLEIAAVSLAETVAVVTS